MIATLKGLKTWHTNDGGGYQVTLLLDGRPAATVTQDGHGGPLSWSVIAPHLLVAWAEINQIADAFSDTAGRVVKCDGILDDMVARLVDAVELDKTLRRWCRTSVIFTMPGDKDGEYRRVPFKPERRDAALAHVRATYAEATIYNERFQ